MGSGMGSYCGKTFQTCRAMSEVNARRLDMWHDECSNTLGLLARKGVVSNITFEWVINYIMLDNKRKHCYQQDFHIACL